MKPIKVLHFIDDLGSGGKERQLVDLLKGLASYKNIICELAIMSHNLYYPEANKLNISIHYLIRRNNKDPKILLKLYNLCKVSEPEIIHTWDSMTSVYAVPIVKILGIKLINGMIRSAPQRLKPFGRVWLRSKFTFPFSDAIISNSSAGIKSYSAPLIKSICIPNGFDFNRIKNLQDKKIIKEKYGINTEEVVGMVASFSNKKDYVIFILAAQKILQEFDNVTFLAIGDGNNLNKCKKRVEPQFQNKIKFLGNQKHVESIINIFDVGVLSTNINAHGEGISNSIMEYMVLGKPVVATWCDGNRELVLNGKTGFLVKPIDVEDMYSKISQLLENKHLRNKMGDAGKERIYHKFSLERMTNSYSSLYENLIKC